MPYIFHCNAQFATGWQRRTVTSKNSLSSFAFKTSRASLFLSQDEFVSIPSVSQDALSADRFLRMIFNLPPKELDTTMHSPGECIKQAISTDIRSRRATSDVRGSSTTSLPPAFCKLAIRPNSFDVRRVKLLLQTLPDVYYGCLNGKFFCVPYSLISTIAIIRGEACDADINNIACQLSTKSPLWKSILHIVPKMIDRRRAFRSCAAGD